MSKRREALSNSCIGFALREIWLMKMEVTLKMLNILFAIKREETQDKK